MIDSPFLPAALALRLAGALALLTLSTGCPSPNIYATPRTTPAGKIVQIAGVEGAVFKSTEDGKKRWTGAPFLPSYQLRYGLRDDVDTGFLLSNASSLGVDLKINQVRTRRLDLALDPGFQLNVYPSRLRVAFLQVPLLLGFNLGDSVSLMLSPGVLVSTAPWGDLGLWWRAGLWARVGGGLNVRLTGDFAIQPEVTVLKRLGASEAAILTPGVGFSYGRLPVY